MVHRRRPPTPVTGPRIATGKDIERAAERRARAQGLTVEQLLLVEANDREQNPSEFFQLLGVTDPEHPMHSLLCAEHAAQLADAIRREEVREEVRRVAIRRELEAESGDRSVSGARIITQDAPRRRGLLSDEDIARHLEAHPIDKRNRDGSPFSDAQRAAALGREQGIEIDRTTVNKRLKRFRSRQSPP